MRAAGEKTGGGSPASEVPFPVTMPWSTSVYRQAFRLANRRPRVGRSADIFYIAPQGHSWVRLASAPSAKNNNKLTAASKPAAA